MDLVLNLCAALILGFSLARVFYRRRLAQVDLLLAQAEFLTQSKTELERELERGQSEAKRLESDLAQLRHTEKSRSEDHQKALIVLNQAQENINHDRLREKLEKEEMEKFRLAALRETWVRHENEVEAKMKTLCTELGITYIAKNEFPLVGKPDNAISIGQEFIVFDSKSPADAEDLANFGAYIRTQAEATKKYTKQEGVKKEVFFVVPTNAIASLKSTHLPMGISRVHVITLDSLFPILAQLKRVEDYEFAEKLSPEDRDKIVGTIGRMAHNLKRRVQVDHFFANEAIAVLTEAENLPAKILEGALLVERDSKINPPTEFRKKKKVELSAIEKERRKLTGKIEGQSILVGDELALIESIPLHKTEQ